MKFDDNEVHAAHPASMYARYLRENVRYSTPKSVAETELEAEIAHVLEVTKGPMSFEQARDALQRADTHES
jgi:hypothetical protein